MIHSSIFKNNPKLYVFLPLFYTVWSDSVLTPSEIATIEGLVNSQGWLNKDERALLLSQLNPSSPPSPDEFMEWREKIKEVAGETGSKDSLVEMGLRLAALHGGSKSEVLEKIKTSFSNIEGTLGFISNEVVYAFQQAHDTVTSKHATQSNFDVAELSKLLDGDNAKTIRKVKTIISDPEFQYIDPGDIDRYRTKVLQWLRYLAEQGYGAIAYPKQYGGSDDMAAY
ncbi:MAG: TerB family tellurite resistance protein, partial [Cyclobacteriaceae bacterium]|nr:TerB family tellurite resistance protein [Cyclobacteriaceae bacterium]